MNLWPVMTTQIARCSLCQLPEGAEDRGLPQEWIGELVLTHVTPDNILINWVQGLTTEQSHQITLQLHRHHWPEYNHQIFNLRKLGVKIETVIDDWVAWDPIVLRQIWTSDRVVVLLNQHLDIWEFLNQCPPATRQRIFFAQPPNLGDQLAPEKALRLFLDVESTFPEVQVRQIPLLEQELDPPSVEWQMRQFKSQHWFLNTLFQTLHFIWPLRVLLWIPFLFLCILQNSMRGNIRQLRAFVSRLQGRTKATFVFSYWAFRRLIACLKIWRVEVWSLRLWTALGPWRVLVYSQRFWTWLAPWRLIVFAQRLWSHIALWRVTVYTQRFLTFLGLWRLAVGVQRLWTVLGLWRITVALRRFIARLKLWRVGTGIRKAYAYLKFWRLRVWAYRFRTWLGLWRIPMYAKRGVDRLGLWRLSVYMLRMAAYATRTWSWLGIWRLGVIVQRSWDWIGIWRVKAYSQLVVYRTWTWLALWRIPVLIGRLWFHMALWRIRALAIRIYWRVNMLRFLFSDFRWGLYHYGTQIHWWLSPWYLARYLVGRYLLKPYYMFRYQYQTRIRMKAVNE